MDLRHLEREERTHEIGVRSAKNELGALARFLDVEQQRAHRLALPQVLAPHLLAPRQQCLGASIEEDQRVAAVDLLDRPGDELADPARILRSDARPLLLAHLLDDHLLGGLDRVPTERAKVEGDLRDLSGLGISPTPGLVDERKPLGSLDRHLTRRIFESFFVRHHFLQQVDADLTGRRIDEDVGVRFRSVLATHGGEHPRLHELDDLAAVDRLLSRELPERIQNLDCHASPDSSLAPSHRT